MVAAAIVIVITVIIIFAPASGRPRRAVCVWPGPA